MKSIPARIDLRTFGEAMSKLDLNSIPPEKRKAALMDYMMGIQAATITDRDVAAQIEVAQKMIRNRTNRSKFILPS